jgi:hypothetical protein
MNILEKERKTKEVELTKKGEEFTVRKGAYHRATGIPQDEKIPMSRINADIKKGGKIGRMARSAKGFKAMHHKGESAVDEKEHPKGPLGTVKGHKTTKKQQALFGIARGMQKGETPKGYSPAAAKLSKGLSGKEVHKIASKPKGGFRRKSSKSETALNRVMQMVAEMEAENELVAEQGINPVSRERFINKAAQKRSAYLSDPRTTSADLERSAGPERTNLPAHASEDAQEFQMINARLDSLEKRLRNLETPGS